MRLLVVGDGPHACDMARTLKKVARAEVVHCRSVGAAERRLNRADAEFGWLIMDDGLDPGVRRRLSASAHCLVSVLGTAASAEDSAPAAPGGDDLERWRNVLAFAAHAPEDYPALRDALVSRPSILQFHAPCKRSA